jgi:hypothetical protein
LLLPELSGRLQGFIPRQEIPEPNKSTQNSDSSPVSNVCLLSFGKAAKQSGSFFEIFPHPPSAALWRTFQALLAP